MKTRQRSLPALSMLIPAFLLAGLMGCKDSTTSPVTSGQISMTTQYSPANSPSDAPAGGFGATKDPVEKGAGIGAIDSLRLTRARFVLRDIKYKTQADSANFRTAPFVLEVNILSAVQDMSVADVPLGTYRRVEFDVHRIVPNDVNTLPASDQVQFQDFLNGETDGYSIIINGTTYVGGQASAFTFRSRINVKQKIDLLPEIVISESSPTVNAMMLVSSGGWFKSSSGVLLDPTDPSNDNTISDNLRASIKVFKDNNKDGSKDVN